jgi:hypothetical protein
MITLSKNSKTILSVIFLLIVVSIVIILFLALLSDEVEPVKIVGVVDDYHKSGYEYLVDSVLTKMSDPGTYHLTKVGYKWCVITYDGTKQLQLFDTKEDAADYVIHTLIPECKKELKWRRENRPCQ